MENNLRKELQKIINRNKPKISRGDSRNGYQLLMVEKRNETFEFPINDFTIATAKTII